MSRPDEDSASAATRGPELIEVDRAGHDDPAGTPDRDTGPGSDMGTGPAGNTGKDLAVRPGTTAERAAADAAIGETVAELTADDLAPDKRRHLLARLVGDVRRRGLGQMFRPRAAMRWMADVVTDVAPHVPVRDLKTLQAHFEGLDGDELAERLIRNASRATAGVGAAGGGVASVEWVVTPTLLSAPVLLAAETVAVVAVELKLIGELHEVYRQPVEGPPGQKAVRLVQAWSGRRGVNPLVPGVGLAAVLGTAARKELQGALLRRFGRHLTSLGPMLTGAAVAGYLNRRATRSVGEEVVKDLKKKRPVIDGDVKRPKIGK